MVMLLLMGTAQAQQTIFNIPSADVTEEGGLFYQHQTGLRIWNPNAAWMLTNSGGYGIGHHTELDVTLYNIQVPHGTPDAPQLALGFKSVIPLNHDSPLEPKLIAGSQMGGSFDNPNFGNWTYAALSGRLPKLQTRLTAGLSYGTRQLFNQENLCFIGGYEQPLSKHWMLQGDWFSGTHNQGNFIPGIVYIMNSGTMLSFGYMIPNHHATSNTSIIFEYTTFVSKDKLDRFLAHRHRHAARHPL